MNHMLKVPPRSFLCSLFRYNGCSYTRGTERLQDRVQVVPNKTSLYGTRSYCTSEDLSIKKCVPCSSEDMRPMTEEAANGLIPKVPGWNLVIDNGVLKLHQSWKVKSFTKGLEFFQEVAKVAEAEGHHPDLHLVGWNNVKIDIWTHAVDCKSGYIQPRHISRHTSSHGGLTDNDFILAAKINGLNLQPLLKRRVAD